MNLKEIDNFQNPHTKDAVEKALYRSVKFRTKQGFDLIPDGFLEAVVVQDVPYTMAIDNLSISLRKCVLFYQTKGYELNERQIDRMVGGLLTNYKNYSVEADKRETYKGNILKDIQDIYINDKVVDADSKCANFNKSFEETEKVLDYLTAVKPGVGLYGKTTELTKAMTIACKAHSKISKTYSSISLELRAMNFDERLRKVVNPNLREAIIDLMQ